MGFVNKIICRLDSEDKYGPLMTELGCRHVAYGAKPQYIDVISHSMKVGLQNSRTVGRQSSSRRRPAPLSAAGVTQPAL
ncbi:hypothetical protein FJT64_023997 [Amphibalanus amphitrite]|uniref:Globin family profile domain-containing protein n=1 Tax=Amphibalanus amphitrite TaxID=1232801 RepID=A0A6A4WBW4_AMPAM|nr:hypothetical protein FJT64_023997 [Amphibalanus amphitrite]